MTDLTLQILVEVFGVLAPWAIAAPCILLMLGIRRWDRLTRESYTEKTWWRC